MWTRLWKLMTKHRGYLILVGIIVGIPVIVNYGLFTWSMPGLQGKLSDWMQFLGSYLGIITALFIAFIQIKKQQKSDHINYIVSMRAYPIAGLLRSNLFLIGVKAHEDSRVIQTESHKLYSDLLEPEQYKDVLVLFLHFKHFGNSKVIYNCSINIEIDIVDKGTRTPNQFYFEGITLPEAIDLYIPLVITNKLVESTDIDSLGFSISYKTIANEELIYEKKKGSNEIQLISLMNEKPEPIIKGAFALTRYIYPKKMDLQ